MTLKAVSSLFVTYAHGVTGSRQAKHHLLMKPDLTDLCLPLLLHADDLVQRQATLILMTTFGTHAFTLLRRRLSTVDPNVRREATEALRVLERHSGHPADYRPFRGIHIECLGTFQVYVENQEILPHHWTQANGSRAGGRKVQGVLAYLMHRGRRGATPEEILAAVWDSKGSAGALARTITALRRTIEQFGGSELAECALVYADGRYILKPAAYTSDVQAFEQAIRIAEQTENERDLETAAPIYRHACALYSGNYMAAIKIAVDDIEERRVELLNAFLNAIERQAEHAYQNGDDDRCLALCRQGLRYDPSDDAIILWKLRCLARQRRINEMKREYWRYLSILGAPPDAEDPVVHWMNAYHSR